MKARRVEIHFDEGGLRCLDGDGVAYVRFADLTDASLESDWLGRGQNLVLERGDREPVRVTLQNVTALDVQRVVLAEIAARVGRPPPPAPLARAGRPLAVWLADVAAGLSAGGYRDGSTPRVELAALLVDPHAEIEARAAAAHALLANDSDDELVATTRAFLEHAMPPLVLAAARLAPGGGALVDDVLADEILPFLDALDREPVTRGPTGGEERITAALARAREAVATTTTGTPVAERGGTHRVLRGTASDPGRWVGRTWGI